MCEKAFKRCKVALIILGLLIIALMLPGRWILFYDKPIKGQVVDAATGKPLEDVLVIGLWPLYQIFGHGYGGYARVKIVATDNEGKFRIPLWVTFKPWKFHSTLWEAAPTIVVYKHGYKIEEKILIERMARYDALQMSNMDKQLAQEVNSLKPAKLRRIYSDEERFNNYLDLTRLTGYPENHLTSCEIDILKKEFEAEFNGMSDKYERKKALINSLKD